jgi:hypothetical protein
MTNPPAIHDVEERALFAARQWFAYWRTHRDSDPLLDQMMTPAGGSAWVRNVMLAAAANTDGGRLSVVAGARQGDPDAIVVTEMMIQAALDRRAPIPSELAAYALDRDAGLLQHHQRHGPLTRDRMTRNWIIMLAVAMLMDHFGLSPTINSKGRPSARRSACMIVAEAHGSMGRKGVEKIWTQIKGGAPTIPGWSSGMIDPSGKLLMFE